MAHARVADDELEVLLHERHEAGIDDADDGQPRDVRLQQGEGRTEALRQAQLALLRRGLVRGQNFSHPYYWASFIQSGEWANLEGVR